MNSKKWSILFVIIVSMMLCIIGGITVVVDPFFHYHKPLDSLEYQIYNQRYQNDGIICNFDYDAIIIGTSMTENFKTSECDKLFNVNAIKVPFPGATYKEIDDNLRRAFSKKSDIKLIIRALDGYMLTYEKNRMKYDSYPTYLMDDVLFNDVQYIFNKEVLLNNTLRVFEYTAAGNKTTTFDRYCNWMHKSEFGKESILASYERPNEKKEKVFSEELKIQTTENILQNVIALAEEYPDVEFYYFFPPYSIYSWDSDIRKGNLVIQIEAYRLATELMLQQENIHIFSFFDEYELTTNPENYKDITHYHEDMNTQILYWMKEGTHQLTKENYNEHWDEVYEFYKNYDYETIF